MRELVLDYSGSPFTVKIEKLDRDKLYGSVEELVVDGDGSPCERAVVAGDGRTVIPKGGAAHAYLDHGGRWIERADMTPLGPDGKPAEAVPSSFTEAPRVATEVKPEDVLLSSARLVYQIWPVEGFPEALDDRLEAGAVFTFPFAYRESLSPDTAFLIRGVDGGTFLLACDPLEVAFVSRRQPVVDEPEVESDGLDFSSL